MTKKCFRCKEVKSLSGFYKHKGMADGHLNKCNTCSKSDAKRNARNTLRKCLVCRRKFYTCKSEVARGGGKYCSRRCFYSSISGEGNYHWKGGRTLNQDGYVLISFPSHPRAGKNGYVLEHIVVMEKHLGRYLKDGETIHHKNEIKTDNRINNLKLYPTKAAHTSHHSQKWWDEKKAA
jgi:hypothetical protein